MHREIKKKSWSHQQIKLWVKISLVHVGEGKRKSKIGREKKNKEGESYKEGRGNKKEDKDNEKCSYMNQDIVISWIR